MLPDIEIKLEKEPINIGNVYIGIISAKELKSCYDKTGESIFFENIRLFRGEDSGKRKYGKNREPVNREIISTINEEPETMLARNNGITFRANSVRTCTDDPQKFFLEKASIVNGCQTTMCLVKVLEDNNNPKSKEACVVIKIVETGDSWDIAEAANFQNSVDQVDLKLARYLRPQTAIQAGIQSRVNVEYTDIDNPYGILENMTINRTTYEEVKTLFLGLFSRSPSNSIASNYTELRYDLLEEFRNKDLHGKDTLDLIFDLQQRANQGSKTIENLFTVDFQKDLFKRFWEKASYRAFLTILASCILVKKNIYAQREVSFDEMIEFLKNIRNQDSTKFFKCYKYAFQTLSTKCVDTDKSREANLKAMNDEVRKLGTGDRFNNLYVLAYSFVEE